MNGKNTLTKCKRLIFHSLSRSRCGARLTYKNDLPQSSSSCTNSTCTTPSLSFQNHWSKLSAYHNFSTSSKSKPPTLPSPSPSSVSNDEVSKFSSMASTWWKVEHNPLISMNPIRMSFITDQIAKHRSMTMDHSKKGYEPFKGLKVLDVGCGGGLLSESMARLGASVTAIDPSAEVAKAAQIHSLKDEKTKYIKYRGGMSVEELASEESESFDVICVLEVIEHATDPTSLMEAAASLLKNPEGDDPGGIIFVSTINRTAKSFGIAIIGGEYISGKLPIGTHSWNQFLSPVEVSGLLGEFNLKEIDKTGMILRIPLCDMRWYFDDSDLDVNWIGAYRHAGL